jgi:hypothetical protein
MGKYGETSCIGYVKLKPIDDDKATPIASNQFQ